MSTAVEQKMSIPGMLTKFMLFLAYLQSGIVSEKVDKDDPLICAPLSEVATMDFNKITFMGMKEMKEKYEPYGMSPPLLFSIKHPELMPDEESSKSQRVKTKRKAK